MNKPLTNEQIQAKLISQQTYYYKWTVLRQYQEPVVLEIKDFGESDIVLLKELDLWEEVQYLYTHTVDESTRIMRIAFFSWDANFDKGDFAKGKSDKEEKPNETQD